MRAESDLLEGEGAAQAERGTGVTPGDALAMTRFGKPLRGEGLRAIFSVLTAAKQSISGSPVAQRSRAFCVLGHGSGRFPRTG